MRTAIIGPGALGCLLAARLHSSHNGQEEILLIDYSRDRAVALNDQGILLEEGDTLHHSRVPVFFTPDSAGDVDILLCCVKSHQLAATLNDITPLFNASTLLVFFQNGISHLHYGDSGILPTQVAYATSSEGATLLGDGHIRHAGNGHTSLGFLDSTTSNTVNLQHLQKLLSDAGFVCSITDDIRKQLWEKLFVNVGINGLTALYNRTNGQLLTSCAARGRLKKLVREAEAVARKTGITIEGSPVKSALAVCRRTAANVSSMLQDVRSKRPTEIDSINGEICRLGKELTINTPVNDELVSQIKQLEKQYR